MGSASRLVNAKGPLVHLANEFFPVGHVGYLSRLVRRVAQRQQKEGLDVRVVIPHNGQLDLQGVNNLHDQGQYLQGVVQGIPVYVIKNTADTPDFSSRIYPPEENALESFAQFGKVFWHLVKKELFGRRPLLQMWDHTMGWVCGQRPYELSRIRTIFTPVEPETHFMHFKPAELEGADLATNGDIESQMEHQGGFVSGFTAGLRTADTVTEWYNGFFHELRDKVPLMASFLAPLIKSGKFEALAASRGWRPNQKTNIPVACIEAFELAYLHTIFGRGHDFSVKAGRLPKTKMSLMISVTEKNPEDPRSPILLERYHRVQPDIPLVDANTRFVDNYSPTQNIDYRENMGGTVQMLKRAIEDPAFSNQPGPVLAFLNGGDGERGFNVVLSACVKGELLLGERTMGDLSIDAAALVARQLPDGGDGWVVVLSCDNYLVPNGPIKLGGRLLSRAEQGLVLFGHSVKILGEEPDRLHYLKDLGVFFVDARTGNIASFAEKKADPQDSNKFDLGFAQREIERYGGENAYKNTFFFAMRRDIARALYLGYEKASHKDGKPLHSTYYLNFSDHFTAACMCSKEEWMGRYSNQSKFDRNDWAYLWDHANRIKKMSGGIGGADIGAGDETWSDVGTIREYYSRVTSFLSGDEQVRRVARQVAGIPEFGSVVRSLVNNVELPGKSAPYLVVGSVFKKGGKVGNNVIVIGSLFEERVEIPDNTIVIGSHVYRLKFKPDDRSPRLIYALHQETTDHPLAVESHCAHSTVHLISGQKMHGVFPIMLNGKELEKQPDGRLKQDPYLKAYTLDRKMTSQSLYGMPTINDTALQQRLRDLAPDKDAIDEATLSFPSVKNLKRLNSLEHSNTAAVALTEAIDNLLSMGQTPRP